MYTNQPKWTYAMDIVTAKCQSKTVILVHIIRSTVLTPETLWWCMTHTRMNACTHRPAHTHTHAHALWQLFTPQTHVHAHRCG